jgi:hypothetical protein
MKNLVKGKAGHLIFWLLLIVYFFSSNSIYNSFFLKNGKPVEVNPKLPPESSSILFKIDYFRPIRYQGENLYEMRGYALNSATTDTGDYKINIVLHSPDKELMFATIPEKRMDIDPILKKFKKSYKLCGFKLLLSKHVLDIENYQVYIVLEDAQTGSPTYIKTGKFIERQMSSIRYIGGDE